MQCYTKPCIALFSSANFTVKPLKYSITQETIHYICPFPLLSSQDVTEALAALHGKPVRAIDPLSDGCGGQTLVLDSLVRTMLSQNTTDITSMRAFKTLKERFPTWEGVLEAPNEEIEDAIRVGGLAAIKCERIKALLTTVKEERGKICLEWLRNEQTETVKAFLSRFKGVGPKTISCVLMFCLHRDEFPVDTHVHHITKALNWCPQTCSREQAYEHLNVLVPDAVKYDLHVLLVKHGKVCSSCSKNGRGVKDCPLVEFKRSKGKGTASPAGKSNAEKKVVGKKRGVAVKVEEDAEESAEGVVRPLKKVGVKKEEGNGNIEVAVKKENEDVAIKSENKSVQN